jgi:hypothetical protein
MGDKTSMANDKTTLKQIVSALQSAGISVNSRNKKAVNKENVLAQFKKFMAQHNVTVSDAIEGIYTKASGAKIPCLVCKGSNGAKYFKTEKMSYYARDREGRVF